VKSRGVSEVTIDLTVGDPAQEIIDRATKGNFSLIVMGSQGKGSVQEVFIGSVSNKVVRHTCVPVLLIPAAPAAK